MLDMAVQITQVLLAVGAIGSVYRIYKGPSVLDRVISLDVMLIIVASMMIVDMVVNDHQDFIMFVVITAVIGFLGAVAIARYAAGGNPAHGTDQEAERQAAGIAWMPAPEPETPASPFSPTGGSESRASAESDESTSWFTNLTKSGFKPQPTEEPKGDDR